ncbi:hypothetical protein [Oceanicella sp. SM1341]|uniref:hypothetical protein n=1 Tax=Oceanicella sp. SM1341 TaxID=1548889 RepID=UPI0018E53E28|nr:hypothetical protein [Oceanicella sp. SM1341]
MANASKKKFGPGQQDQAKGDGSGADAPDDVAPLPDNEILSNRDTSRHSDQRSLDSREMQNRQYHETVASHAPGAGEPGEAGRKYRRGEPDLSAEDMKDLRTDRKK